MIITDRDFVVAEQRLGGYELHVFLDRQQFENWRRDNPSLRIISRTNARGGLQSVNDHRGEFEYS